MISRVKRLAGRWHWLLIIASYILALTALTWPWLADWTHYYLFDQGDGYQNFWNSWWFGQVWQSYFDQIPGQLDLFKTNYLHYPHGVNLGFQTFSIWNLLWIRLLQTIFTPLFSFNLAIIAAYVLSAYYGFCLAQSFGVRVHLAWLAGLAIGLSQWHLTHGYGHLNLITIYPLLAMTYYLRKQSWLGVGLALVATGLSDYYYLLYGLVIIFLVLATKLAIKLWRPASSTPFWQRVLELWIEQRGLIISVVMAGLALLPVVWPTLSQLITDPPLNSHNPRDYGLDLASIFYPGQIWRFNALTETLWSRNYLGLIEGSQYFGLLGLIGLFAWLFSYRRLTAEVKWLGWLGLIFLSLAIGPTLHIFRHSWDLWISPYKILTTLLPPLQLAGVASRYANVSQIVFVLVGAIVLQKLTSTELRRGWLVISCLAIVIAIESSTNQLPRTPLMTPTWLESVKQQGPVIDRFHTPEQAMYWQTLHRQPLYAGYVSRLPASTAKQTNAIGELINQQDFQALSQLGFRQVIVPLESDWRSQLPTIYSDANLAILQLP